MFDFRLRLTLNKSVYSILMNKNLDKLLTASKLKNWLACNYTTINEINKKELKKKNHQLLKKLEKKGEINLKKKFIEN